MFLYQPYFALESTEIVEKEKEICDVQDDFQFKMKSSEIHSLAYRLGLNKNVYTYCFAFDNYHLNYDGY